MADELGGPLSAEALANRWEHLAKCQFASAKTQSDDFGRRFVEHGAMSYFNCAQELKALAQGTSLLPPSTNQEGQ